MDQAEKQDQLFDENPLLTIKRELISIGSKIRYVVLLLPRHREESLNHFKQWDLWGPLLICLFFSLSLALFAEGQEYKNDDFINVFIIFWLGALLVSINCKLLGGKGSLFRMMSAIGYCLVPLSIFGFIASIIPSSGKLIILKLIIIIIALLWSTGSCILVMSGLVNQTKQYLCGYPVLLFYIFLAWYSIVA